MTSFVSAKYDKTLNRNQVLDPNSIPGPPATFALDAAGTTILGLTNAIDGSVIVFGGTINLAPGIAAATANSAIIQAALNLGGLIQLPAGKFYVNANALKAVALGTLYGAGSNNGGYFWSLTQAGNLAEQAAGTTLATISQTGWILGLDVSGFNVEGIHFQNESVVNGAGVPTAGGGVRIGSLLATTGIASSKANGTRITKCSTYGCYVGIDLYSADSYVITENVINNFVWAGVQINNCYNPNTANPSDFGDPIISGNQITNGLYGIGASGIHWVAGGGVKILGNKINGNGLNLSSTYYLTNGIWFDPASTTSTSVFTIVGNSIEGIIPSGSAIKIVYTTNTAVLAYFTISGNEIGAAGNFLTIAGRASGNMVSRGYVGGNVCNGVCVGKGIVMSYCQHIIIDQNVFGGMATTQKAISLGELVMNCQFSPQIIESTSWVTGDYLQMYEDTSAGSSYRGAGLERNSFIHKYTNSVSFATKQAAYLNCFMLQPGSAAYAGYRIRLVIEGNLSGIGSLFYSGERILSKGTGGIILVSPNNNVALPLGDQVIIEGVIVGAIVSSGTIVTAASGAEAATAGINVNWNITADATTLYLQLSHTSGTGAGSTNAFYGTAHIEIIGTCDNIRKYRMF